MLYPVTLGTRVPTQVLTEINALAKEFGVSESVVSRVALREFVRKPRVARERLRAALKARAEIV